MPGALCTVVALVGSVLPPPVAKVVEVAVTFQPAPEPVPSPMSRPWVAVVVRSVPLRATENVTSGGGATKASEPAGSVAVAVAAPAAGAPAPRMARHAASAAMILGVDVFTSRYLPELVTGS